MANYSIHNRLGAEDNRSPELGNSFEDNDRSATTFEQDVMDIMWELGNLLVRKHMDYGPKNISEAPGGAINGLLVRMHDKMARLKNLHYNNKSANYESIEDTYKDLANYAVIALMVLRDKWDK
jgi:predicted transcriptional regulator